MTPFGEAQDRLGQAHDERKATCHFCAAAEISPVSHFGSPLCEGHLAIQEHVVSMQRGVGGSYFAVCQCGWRSSAERSLIRETQVRLHWAGIVQRAVAA